MLPWSESSWERQAELPPCAAQLASFDAAQRAPCVPPSAAVAAIRPAHYEHLEESPTYGPNQDRTLRAYQLEGVNWMVDCWHKRRNVMLADEMGLGKTAQCVATLSHIHALGPAGPFLIVAPLSTINHWARELRAWSSLRTVVLHGSAADRKLLLKRLWHAAPGPRGGARPGYFFHVVVTTYETLLLEERLTLSLTLTVALTPAPNPTLSLSLTRTRTRTLPLARSARCARCPGST